jgi:hypothetical protein
MSGKRRIAILLVVAASVAILISILVARRSRFNQPGVITGVVLRRDPDARDQLPIAGAEVTAESGISTESSTSDASGLFHLRIKPRIKSRILQDETVALRFRHREYQPLEMNVAAADDRVLVIHMTPVRAETSLSPATPASTIGNVRVRYASKTTTTVNVGSTVKSFEVVNTGNVPCNDMPPCSPDGKWKATVGGVSLDAGDGNEFGNARVSCIAGPCPFTKIETDNFSSGGRRISVTVRNWSDTATFLVEAEVFRTMASDTIRRFYPIIFGQAMNFTLPAEAQGPSIEADLNGADIVFPLGPDLNLSWGNCSLIVGPDHTKRYHCELKPGYRFS